MRNLNRRSCAGAVATAALVSALGAALVGCASQPYWLVEFDHLSNPAVGYPFDDRCDPSADFLGAGVGLAWERRRSTTEIDVAIGQKRIRECIGNDGIQDHTLGGRLAVRHKIPFR